MKDKIILHVDANSFFASVECAQHPDLENLPVAVSGNPAKRNGIILAKNELAKKCGVQTGEPICKAKSKCPNLVCIYPQMHLYEKYSHEMRNIFKKYTNLIESMGLDECWLDITDTAHIFGGAEKIATDIRNEIKEKLHITVSVGISFCKLFAKLGSDLKKPDAQTIISRKNYKQIVYPLPINSIIGIGNKMTEHLHKMNVFLLGDLINIPGYILKNNFNKTFFELRKKLLGFDHEPVRNIDQEIIPKSISNGITTLIDIFDKDDIRSTITFLADKVCSRLRFKNLFANCVEIGIKTCNFDFYQKSKSLAFPTNSAQEITEFAIKILNSFWKYNEKIRSIRISTKNLSNSQAYQISIFDQLDSKNNGLNIAIDQIREKYGNNSIAPASLFASNIIRENFAM